MVKIISDSEHESYPSKGTLTNNEDYSGHITPLGHHTDRGPVGVGQNDSLGEYCDPHTATSVFLILLFYCNILQ